MTHLPMILCGAVDPDVGRETTSELLKDGTHTAGAWHLEYTIVDEVR